MNELYVIMYHYVRSISHSRYTGVKGLEYADFIEQIEFLKRNFTFVTMEDVINAYNGGSRLPDKAVLLTFDDGYIDCWTNVFPLLSKEGIQASFFVSGEGVCDRKLMDVNCIQFMLAEGQVTEIRNDLDRLIDCYRNEGESIPPNAELFSKYAIANRFDSAERIYVKRLLQTVLPEPIRHEIVHTLFDKYSDVPEGVLVDELYMSMDQLRHMRSAGMHVGIHGYEHVWGEHLSESEMKTWIDRSLEGLHDCIDTDNWTMSYPYGSYNDDMIKYIKERGCKLAFLSQVGRALVDEKDRYKIVRYDCNDFPPRGNGYMNKNKLETYK